MLVDYPDSESDTQEQTKPVKRRKLEPTGSKQPPPLPSNFHSLYATNVRVATADDPSLYGGRSRQVPHVEGNWPTHISLEWFPTKNDLDVINDIITRLQDLEPGQSSIQSFLKSNLDVQQPLHISLSAPLVLRTEQKDAFQDAVTRAVKASEARKFRVTPTTVEWVPNMERSRYFLVLKLTKPVNDDLNKLLAACNACVKAWGMNPLYTNSGSDHGGETSSQTQKLGQDESSAFHVSIAWTLGKPSDAQQTMLEGKAYDQLRGIGTDFACVKIKVGNVVTDVPLPDR